jgi:adenosine kinase
MRLVVTGSIATDHLMTFPGRFTDSLVADKLDQISLSFLVADLDIRRGGVAANIAFGLGVLGLRPVLVGAVGEDFADYRSWLERHGVDTESVHVSEVLHTARFICTTDVDGNQIASFYPGAMAEAGLIELGPVLERVGDVDLVLVGPDDPTAMLRHTAECRQRGIAFVSDPSQQLAAMAGEQIRELVDGAAFLFTNEYEAALTEQKTGWSAEEILQRVGYRVTTRGPAGVVVDSRDGERVVVGTPQEQVRADPTGVGDGFRAGFLAGLGWGLDHTRCAQLGCLLATHVLETVGTQEYRFEVAAFVERMREAYGDAAADDVAGHLVAAV